MNHYPHHIGDFNNATRHLTLVERALYRELIELYYDTEQPLRADDFEWLSRRIVCPDDQKDTLKYILSEFFVLDLDVYRHARCDQEIALFHSKVDTARRAGKASAQRRANARSTSVSIPLNQPEPEPEPEPEPVKKARKRATLPEVEKPEEVAAQTWNDWLQLRKGKRAAVTETVLKEARVEAEKAKMSLDRFLAVWCVRGSQGLQAEWLKDDKTRKAELAQATVPSNESIEQMRARLDADKMTPEQWEASKKVKALAMASIKNITPRAA